MGHDLGTFRHWQIKKDSGGILWLSLDRADREVNTLSRDVLNELARLLEDIPSQRPAGVVICSGKPNGFVAGADVTEFSALADSSEALKLVGRVHEIFERIERLPFPTVCLIHGFCFGGGLELALACRSRVATDVPETRFGLPEVKLGIHPGFGGTVRMPRLIGLLPALDLMLSGRSIDARQARKIGLVDYAVPERQITSAVRAAILHTPSRKKHRFLDSLFRLRFIRRLLACYLHRMVSKHAAKKYYPAPHSLLDLWERFGGDPAVMYREEARSVADLVTGDTSKNLVRVFLLQERMKALGRNREFSPRSLSENSEGSRARGFHSERKARGGGDAVDIVDDEQRRDRRATPMRPSGYGEAGASAALPLLNDDTASPASRRLASAPASPGTRPLLILGQAPSFVHVIGGGTMGGDIAAWCVLQGLRVTIQDVEHRRLAVAVNRASSFFRKKLKEPRLVQDAMDRFMPDLYGDGIPRADIVIEAIFEDATAKRKLYQQIEPRMRRDALLATNTSSIPLEALGESLMHPGRFVGLHFFNPVAKMLLVEVVRGEAVDAAGFEGAIGFVTAIGRLPLPVASSPGFLINRILTPYMLEAVAMEQEGIPPADVDRAACEFGMPMGPILLADTVGLDICLSVTRILAGHFGTEIPKRLENLVGMGRLGKKSGHGFYVYKKGKPVLSKKKIGSAPGNDIADRLMLRLLNEAVACWREGIVADCGLLDAGAIFGIGFPPFRGGPLHYIRTEGVEALNTRLRALEERYGARFAADPGWRELLRQETKQ